MGVLRKCSITGLGALLAGSIFLRGDVEEDFSFLPYTYNQEQHEMRNLQRKETYPKRSYNHIKNRKKKSLKRDNVQPASFVPQREMEQDLQFIRAFLSSFLVDVSQRPRADRDMYENNSLYGALYWSGGVALYSNTQSGFEFDFRSYENLFLHMFYSKQQGKIILSFDRVYRGLSFFGPRIIGRNTIGEVILHNPDNMYNYLLDFKSAFSSLVE